ncbi:MAG: hypothetical protein WBM41_07885 [Arenicellales bacterium]
MSAQTLMQHPDLSFRSWAPDPNSGNELLTMHFGFHDILLNLSIDFVDGISASEVEALISKLEIDIKSAHPEITRVFIEAQNWRGHDDNLRAN